MTKALQGVIIFTIIEWVFLVAWGVILDLGIHLPFRTQVIAAVVLFVGLFVEHFISVNVGRDLPPFKFPPG